MDHDAEPVVRLCGGLQVGTGESALGPRDLGGSKARYVLLALLLDGGTAVSKNRLIDYLWADTPPAGALGTLEAYVCLLRKKLAPALPGPSPVVTVPGGYRWDVDRAPVDVVEFARRATEARADALAAGYAVPAYERAISLVPQVCLPDEVDLPWLQEHIRVHHTLVLNVYTEGARAALDADNLQLAERWARRALERDGLLESSWLVLLETLERSGQQAAAVREYATCRRTFSVELGCDPGPALRNVFSRLLAATSADDGDLPDLVEAVVRLHEARFDGPKGGASLREDYRLLEELLRITDARAGHPALARPVTTRPGVRSMSMT